MRRVSTNIPKFLNSSKKHLERVQPKIEVSSSVPQIFFNEKHIGGRDDFQKLDQKELEELIKYVQENEPPEGSPSIPGSTLLIGIGEDDGQSLRCEYDTDADIAKALKDSNLPKKRWNWLQRHHGAFTGKQLKEWLDGTGEDGEAAATRLLAGNFIAPIEKKVDAFHPDGTLYQLVEQKSIASLNSGVTAECKVLHPSELGEQMRIQIKKLYGKYLNDDGTSVDYEGMRDSEEFGEYVKLTAVSSIFTDSFSKFFLAITAGRSVPTFNRWPPCFLHQHLQRPDHSRSSGSRYSADISH